jgi:hypothetical protein
VSTPGVGIGFQQIGTDAILIKNLLQVKIRKYQKETRKKGAIQKGNEPKKETPKKEKS